MRSDDIVSQRFTTTRFEPGYDQREVDAFLERSAATLRCHEVGDRADNSITASEAIDVRFTPSRFRVGYDVDEVDHFLDKLAAALRRFEGSSGAREGASAGN
ncbi:MAG: DivIVA domain-containing protein [Pseudoclavibacter sp.]